MLNLFNVNSLVHWDEKHIELREDLIRFFSREVGSFLTSINSAWMMKRAEAPVLVPRNLISSAYGNDDIFVQERLSGTETELVLRPETTPTTYVYMQDLLNNHTGTKLPLCVWQAGLSFRREQEQPSKHMRLKQFWQMEFQCAFTADTGMDYHQACLEPIRKMIATKVHLPSRIVPSDRLPSYSQVTMDIEVDNGDKWMEICSISRRTDFPQRYRFAGKKNEVQEKDVLVLEIAIGLDRCLYNWDVATEQA